MRRGTELTLTMDRIQNRFEPQDLLNPTVSVAPRTTPASSTFLRFRPSVITLVVTTAKRTSLIRGTLRTLNAPSHSSHEYVFTLSASQQFQCWVVAFIVHGFTLFW